MKPVFSEEFMVDVRNTAIRHAISQFSRTGGGHMQQTNFTFHGLERPAERFEFTVRFQRDGLLNTSSELPLRTTAAPGGQAHEFIVTAIDVLLRSFVGQAVAVYEAAEISAPFILGMILRTQAPLVGVYGGRDGFAYETPTIPIGDYHFPFVDVDDLSAGDAIIRPLCDQAHQLFGLEGSPSFNAEGVWTARYG